MTRRRALTPGQLATLDGLANDKRPTAIADELGVSPQRVSQHIERLIDLDLLARYGPKSYLGYAITNDGWDELIQAKP